MPFRLELPSAAFAVAALAVVLGAAPAAQAKDAFFTATVQAEATLKSTTTSTETQNCYPAFAVGWTASRTIRLRTAKAQPVTAHVVDAGSSRGLVELGPSGSGYAKIPGVVGTIEGQADNKSAQCPGAPVDRQDCGTRTSTRWDLVVQPRSSRRRGRESFQGLGVYWGTEPDRLFTSCLAPASPNPQIADVAPIDTRSLFDKRRRQIVLHIKATTPWHFDDKASRTVTDGTYFRSITLTLRRTG